jgi:FAD/FMN-containing dehydrogenase
MKNALVVYESMFGGTREVAEAVADGLRHSARCTVVEVGAAPTVVDHDVDLLVVGAPTHAFGLSTPDTRQAAQDETSTPVISRDRGVREWLAVLVVLSHHTRTAAFDTHVKQRWVPGSAAHKIAHALARKGLSPAAEPISIRVEGRTGPLIEGELDRARTWGEALGQRLADITVQPAQPDR